jgi:hypothetical protein
MSRLEPALSELLHVNVKVYDTKLWAIDSAMLLFVRENLGGCGM